MLEDLNFVRKYKNVCDLRKNLKYFLVPLPS